MSHKDETWYYTTNLLIFAFSMLLAKEPLAKILTIISKNNLSELTFVDYFLDVVLPIKPFIIANIQKPLKFITLQRSDSALS